MNYSDEEKKAIKIVKCITEDDLLNYWEGPEEPYNAIQTILNLIQKQSKIIDKMAEEILKIDTVKSKFEYDHAKVWDTEKGIKEYFEKVVDEDVKD